tara:strand:- start:668 stop:1393 length:726 start_codon:yes stop_codon:yes gene_type:complete
MTHDSLLSHFKELRKRVTISVICFIFISIATYFFYDYIYLFLSAPFKNVSNSINNQFFIYSVIEGVTVKIQFSFLAGLILSSPIVIYHVLRFIFPGLKSNEKKTIIVSLGVGTLLGVVGFVYSYFLLIPISLNFLVSQQFLPSSVGILLDYSKNIFFVFNLLIYLILIFQTPILLWSLLAFNIISRSFLWKSTRIIIILIFIFSAFLTPPDILTQLMVAIPLCFLFFISLSLAQIFKVGDQ